MMKVDDIIPHIDDARLAHMRWVARAEALVEGLPLDKSQVPVLSTDCKFGQWYHGKGHALHFLTSYVGIDAPHRALHKTYQNIFKILYAEDDRSLLGKLFGSSKEYEKERYEEAAALIPRLRSESELVMKALDLLAREINIKAKGGVLKVESDEVFQL